jgi:hypothetical protein
MVLSQIMRIAPLSAPSYLGDLLCNLYLFLGSDPVWSTRGLKQLIIYLAEVRINRSLRHSVYID